MLSQTMNDQTYHLLRLCDPSATFTDLTHKTGNYSNPRPLLAQLADLAAQKLLKLTANPKPHGQYVLTISGRSAMKDHETFNKMEA